MIEEIKSDFDMAVTLSVGERRRVDYSRGGSLKAAGCARHIFSSNNRGLQ
jgi:hypothetical protein